MTAFFSRFIFLIISLVSLNYPYLLRADRPTSYPFIAGDTFRAHCDYIMDETGINIIPEQVQRGSTIFLKTDYLADFFGKYHSLIANPYVLVTHNSDYPCPGAYQHMLDDAKLLAWFGQNVEGCIHPKLHPIPIGVANRYWSHGDIGTVAYVQKLASDIQKNFLLYMNFEPNNYRRERPYVYHYFLGKPFCVTRGAKDFRSYLIDLCHSKFVLSPRGNGVDCHRTWESLLMGAVPIVRSSDCDELYNGLPVCIIKKWEEIDEDMLNRTWAEMGLKNFQTERMYADYWFQRIDSFKPIKQSSF